MDEVKRLILTLEALTRQLVHDYDVGYAAAHLKEINLQAQLMLVQLEYAKLAHEGLA